MDAGEVANSPAGWGALVLALAIFVHQLGRHMPAIVDALQRVAAAVLEWAKAVRMRQRQEDSFHASAMRRIAKLETDLEEERAHRIIERGRLAELEHLASSQALTIAELRRRLDESERRAAAAVAAREQVIRDAGAGGGSDERAMPTAHAPEHGREETGRHKTVKP
jgi:hypothetical protein